MQININSNCIGCGMCAQLAPDVYEVSGGQAIVKADADLTKDADSARAAAASCPVQAIEITE